MAHGARPRWWIGRPAVRTRGRRTSPHVRQLETRLTPSLTTLASLFSPPHGVPQPGLVRDGSGNLYGVTEYGGAHDHGAVFELAHDTGAMTTLASFNDADGAYPSAGLIIDGSGNLYGTTTQGGASGDGTVFELAHGSAAVTTLASFSGTDGSDPQFALVMDAAGNLYGTTAGGGAAGDGTVFELAKGSGTITTLASFSSTTGSGPYGALTLDAGGNLYGATSAGGASGDGTLFEVVRASKTIATLASFNGTDGTGPQGPLLLDGGGNLYGTTFTGGTSNVGTVFELAAGSGSITTLASFSTAGGYNPVGGLALDGGGNLDGATESGGASGDGTVFELAAGSGSITALASFNGTDGATPLAGPVMDGSGNLYGTTSAGGACGYGTVFELAAGSGTITTLGSFNGTTGKYPYGGLIMDASGNLYGTTAEGGASNDGTVFETPRGSGTVLTLASFMGTNGAVPEATLLMDSKGNLYGTTTQGGTWKDGTVFELAAGSGSITTLASFNSIDGSYPAGGLVMDGSGNLYGTTTDGGVSGYGTVFELARGSRTITTLASFDATDGAYPYCTLVMDGGGNLYGTTEYGGASGYGAVFELAAGSGTITTLASFDGTDGAGPQAGLIMDGHGNFFGTTLGGGTPGAGTVFELAAGSGTITTLASFDKANGQQPLGGLVMDSQGNLFGTTNGGGAFDYGTVFEMAKGSGAITTLASFDRNTGKYPYAGLVMDSQGNLYGTVDRGSATGHGAVFEFSGPAPVDQWTGANSAVDTNWSDGANWSLEAPPTVGQTALFTYNSSVQSLTSTVDAGFTHPIAGLLIENTWGGTITVSGALSVTRNLVLGSGTLGGSGTVTIAGRANQLNGGSIAMSGGGTFTNSGTLTWTSGQIGVDGGSQFLNTGTLNVETPYHSSLVLAGTGALTNHATLNEAGYGNVLLENGVTLDNTAGATFDLINDAGVSQFGGGTFTNAGTLEKNGGTGTSTLASTTLDNTGVVLVKTGTVDVAATVSQVTRRTLTAGHWFVSSTPTVAAVLDITSAGSFTTLGAGAVVTLSGPRTAFANLSYLNTIDSGARFSLLGGLSFAVTGALTNKGSMILSPGSVCTAAGSFAQTSTGSLTVELAGPSSAPTFGQVLSTTGTVSLAGSLDVTSGFVPAVGSSFTLLENEGNSPIGGAFAGLPEGATFTVKAGKTTMTFQITYIGPGTYGDNNVAITRTS